MQQIQEILYETYNKNIDYFKKKHPELQKSIQVLEIALDNGDFTPNYELEYKDNYFDIIELSTNRPLYGSNSLEISEKITQNITKSKVSYSFEGVPVANYSQELIDTIEDLDAIPTISHYYREQKAQEGTMIEIEKFVLVGVGLGLHIPFIHNKIYPKYYMIIEDNIEIFRLSLFTTKYYELAIAAELSFAIAQEHNEFLDSFDTFLDSMYFYNRFIKYFHFSFHSKEKLKYIRNALASQDFFVYTYKPMLAKILQPLEYLNNGYKSLHVLSDAFQKETILRDQEILVLGAGPSFSNNIEWIKENQNSVLILAVSTVLPLLFQHNIKPDMIMHMDSSTMTEAYYDKIDMSFLDETIVFLGSQVQTTLRNKFHKKNIFYIEDQYSYMQNIGTLAAPCVGSMSTLLAISLCPKTVYMLGVDLAFDQESGSTHGKGIQFAKNVDFQNSVKETQHISLEEEIIQVKGNFRDKVYTNPLLMRSSIVLTKLIPSIILSKQKVYNLSDGAYIQSTTPLQIPDTIFPNKKRKENFINELYIFLEKNSTMELKDEDIALVKDRVAFAHTLQDTLIYYSKKEDIFSSTKHLSLLLQEADDIFPSDLNNANKALTNIYHIFFKFILPIIFDFYNTEEISFKKEHTKVLNHLIQKELQRICEIYLEKTEKFLEERC